MDHLGGIVAKRGAASIFHVPRPVMVDSRGETSVDNAWELESAGPSRWRVTARLDKPWIADNGRAWPVTIDPTVNTFVSSASRDCQYRNLHGVTVDCDTEDYYDYRYAGSGWQDSLWPSSNRAIGLAGLEFATPTVVQTDRIESAVLKVHQLDRSAPNGSELLVVPNSAAIPYFTLGAGYPDAWESMTLHSDGMLEADVTSIVDRWQQWTNSGGSRGLPNFGFIVLHRFGMSVTPFCAYAWYPCDWTRYAASSHPDPSKRPVLEVRSWPAAPAGSEMLSPEEGDLTGRFVRLEARVLHSSVATVRYQYIAGNGRRWSDVPVEALRTSRGAAIVSADIPVRDGRSDTVVWDLAATPDGHIDGPVHVRAYLESPLLNQGGVTPDVGIRAERDGIDGTAAVSVGPGDVDLLTGKFSMAVTDATQRAFLNDLRLTRTYSSRGVSSRNADMFGAGWDASVAADGGALPYKGIYNFTEIRQEAQERYELRPAEFDWERYNNQLLQCWLDAEDEAAERACEAMKPSLDYKLEDLSTVKRWEYRYAVVELADGTKATFRQTLNPDGTVTGWLPGSGLAGYSIEHRETTTPGIWEFILSEPGGGTARFRSEIRGSPNYRIVSYQEPGSTSSISYSYEPSGNRMRLKRVTAPYPAGGTPRWMELEWADVGSGNQRVIGVNNGQGTAPGAGVARYAYNARGKLLRAWDPRAATLATEYVYDNRGLLAEVRPPGEEEWRFAYEQFRGDVGYRLVSASRDHPSMGTATQTIRYDVPLSGPGAPYEMGATETARWGQVDDVPWQAVAVFPADEVPTATGTDFSKATIHYLDLEGREVNVAAPGGAITTTEYDAHDNPIRTLTARNRATALNAGSASASLAHDLSTLHSYSVDGVDLTATYEPKTEIRLSNGTAVRGRRFTTTHYDAGAPRNGYGLPTSRFRGVEIGPGNRADERQLVRYGYDGFGGMSGWEARHPTQIVVDPNGLRLTSYSILHPSHPLVEETRRPRGAGGGARPDVRFYQYADIAAVRVPAALRSSGPCEAGTPSGFLCMDAESTAPEAEVPRRWYGYDATLGLQTDLWEGRALTKASGPVRRTTTRYDVTGRPASVAITGGAGDPVPVTTFAYSATTGRPTATAATGRGTVSLAHDSNGRLQSYTDASGLTTRFTYDLRGRATQTVENEARVVRYAYDVRDNMTSVSDPSVPGPVTATHGLDDELLTESLPGGLRAAYDYDELGVPAALRWEQTTGCSSDCVRAQSAIGPRDADGRITGERSLDSTAEYLYDTVGRLVQADEEGLTTETCVRQQFTYDASFNRTSADTITSRPAGDCGDGSVRTRSWTHDAADRMTTIGWAHDGFGRATAVPAPDSGGRGLLTAGYYADDLVRSLSLDGRTHSYERDPLGRTASVASTGGASLALTTVNRYADDGDSPVATVRSDGTEVREITGPSGQLVALKDGTELTYQLRDLQGSIVATVPSGEPGGRPSARTIYDPFGIVTSATPNVIDWAKGAAGYGWLGAYQRSTEFEQYQESGSPVEMGVRVYLPAVGRFLQVDPIDGGSANPYEYAMQDPINTLDLNGTNINPWASFERAMEGSWIFNPFESVPALLKRCAGGTFWGQIWGSALEAGRQLLAHKRSIDRNINRLKKIANRNTTNYKKKRNHYLKKIYRDIGGMMKAARSITALGVFTACVTG